MRRPARSGSDDARCCRRVSVVARRRAQPSLVLNRSPLPRSTTCSNDRAHTSSATGNRCRQCWRPSPTRSAWCGVVAGESLSERRLRSEMAFIRLVDSTEWLAFRNVLAVNDSKSPSRQAASSGCFKGRRSRCSSRHAQSPERAPATTSGRSPAKSTFRRQRCISSIRGIVRIPASRRRRGSSRRRTRVGGPLQGTRARRPHQPRRRPQFAG